ncbi:hypothetical protein BIY23_04485 [Wolbachia pipientis]|uniref:Uncharacterized protein n=1 Tax=Wolbachia pipientis TaxID=955 RepID=A0A1E7QJG4_WOLPI|nr:hypothetical protein BIY23_04485 [Wolbachia pipientis]
MTFQPIVAPLLFLLYSTHTHTLLICLLPFIPQVPLLAKETWNQMGPNLRGNVENRFKEWVWRKDGQKIIYKKFGFSLQLSHWCNDLSGHEFSGPTLQ